MPYGITSISTKTSLEPPAWHPFTLKGDRRTGTLDCLEFEGIFDFWSERVPFYNRLLEQRF